LIVKELIRYCLQHVDKAFCLSAAKKKEYEAFSYFRQLLFLQLRLQLTFNFCRFRLPARLCCQIVLALRSTGRRTIARHRIDGKCLSAPFSDFFAHGHNGIELSTLQQKS
jgi:hypothetical protein